MEHPTISHLLRHALKNISYLLDGLFKKELETISNLLEYYDYNPSKDRELSPLHEFIYDNYNRALQVEAKKDLEQITGLYLRAVIEEFKGDLDDE